MANVKYTEEQRETVRRLIVTGMPYKDIEEKTGVTYGYIKNFIAFSMDKTDKEKLIVVRKKIGRTVKYTEEERKTARKLILTGMPYQEIAEKMGMSHGYIEQLTYLMDKTDKDKLIAVRKRIREMENEEKQKRYTIYAVLMNGEPVYVGKTTKSLNRRFLQHCSREESAIYPLIKKYGRENFAIETLAVTYDEQQAAMLEDKWTIYLFDDSYKLSNKQIGNHGYIGISKKTRENIDEWLNAEIKNEKYEELEKKYEELKEALKKERREKDELIAKLEEREKTTEQARQKEIDDAWANFN